MWGSNQEETFQGSQELYDPTDLDDTQEQHMNNHTETAVDESSTNSQSENAWEGELC